MTTVGEANVIVRPVVQDFRSQLAQQVNGNIGRAGIDIPVSPKVTGGAAALSWERIAGGAAIPVPITPTITPQGRAAFGSEVGGLRGLLLGGGQFAASRALGIGSAAAGLFVFAKGAIGAVKAAGTLEQELNVFEQVSGASADQMARVREESRALGADLSLPAVSAGDAAATMTALAKAGLTVDEVLNGTRGTLQLAAAANLDFATSSELVADALNSFQLPGSNAIKVADLLAGASNAAQGDIGDFGVALSQAGAVAHQAGVPLDETVTFLTELAKAGIQGSDAGTSLRTTLLRLIAPTDEARAIFRELGIEITDAQGNVRTDVFEQLRREMDRLEPATRNTALATIFGADAVRAAAVFVRDGAEGHAELARQVERSGQASETAAARTEGLLGSVSGLGSNLETLGTDLGDIVLPVLTPFVGLLSTEVSGLDRSVIQIRDAVSDAADAVADASEKFGQSGFAKFVADAASKTIDFGNDARRATDDVLGLRGAVNATGKTAPLAFPNLKGFAGAGDRSSPQFDEAARHAAAAGKDIGQSFSRGVSEGIKTDEERAVARAREALTRVVAEGRKAVAEAIRQGNELVEAAAFDAKQNLAQIGSDLAQQAVELLDTGPLAQQIERLQSRLDRSRTGAERGRLRNSLRDARQELDRAEAAIAGGGGSAAQRAAEQDFLRPFREKVKDAQSALEEFNTQGNLDKLRARLEAQKDRLKRLLDDVIARFNAGLLSAPAANREAAAILERNVGPMSRAGKAQGAAFRQRFVAELDALRAQINAIVLGPQTKKTGAEPRVVSPGDVALQAAADVREAREAATRAQVQATRSVEDAVRAEQKATEAGTEVLKDIRRQLGQAPAPSAKPSSTAAPQPRRARTGGR